MNHQVTICSTILAYYYYHCYHITKMYFSFIIITWFTNNISYKYAINICITFSPIIVPIFIIFGTIYCNISSFIVFEANYAIFLIFWVANKFKNLFLGMNRFTTMTKYHFVIATLTDSIPPMLH